MYHSRNTYDVPTVCQNSSQVIEDLVYNEVSVVGRIIPPIPQRCPCPVNMLYYVQQTKLQQIEL